MPFIVSKPESSFTPAPAGNHIARCYGLIDLGTQKKSFNGEDKGAAPKIRLTWELFTDEKRDDGKPFSISKSYFMSLHEKSALRRDLQSWRGRAFTTEEEAMFDVSKLVGVYCMLNLIEEHKGDSTYTNVASIAPFPKGLPKPEPINEPVLFDISEPDMEIFASFGEKTKEMIVNSPEWKRKNGAVATPKTTGNPAFDDETPF